MSDNINHKKHFEWQGDTLLLHCHLQPNAAGNHFAGIYNHRLKIRISTPPIDGKANKQLIAFLSQHFAVPKSAITLQKGALSQQKTLAIHYPAHHSMRLPEEAMLAAKPPHT